MEQPIKNHYTWVKAWKLHGQSQTKVLWIDKTQLPLSISVCFTLFVIPLVEIQEI